MNSTEVAPSDSPFVTSSVNSHSNFTAIRTPVKLPKPPKGPEKPLMPYMRYSREVWESVKASQPDQKLSEIGRTIGRLWRELAPHEKQKYIDDYEVDKAKYTEAFKIYQNSTAYQQYLVAKEKFQADEKEVKVKASTKLEPRITLPACDNDDAATDDLDYFHLRQLAAARFHRNQRLLQEVFNEACVPDLRQTITAPRLLSLKRQVETLTMHQRKIDTEVNQLVETFETKKRRLEDGSREFQSMLDKCTKPAVTSTAYDTMVEQAERQLLERYKIYLKAKEQQQQQSADAKETNMTTSEIVSTIDSNDQDHKISPIKSTSIPLENGNTEIVVKAESIELQNGNGSTVAVEINVDLKMVTSTGGENGGENGHAVELNGIENGCKSE